MEWYPEEYEAKEGGARGRNEEEGLRKKTDDQGDIGDGDRVDSLLTLIERKRESWLRKSFDLREDKERRDRGDCRWSKLGRGENEEKPVEDKREKQIDRNQSGGERWKEIEQIPRRKKSWNVNAWENSRKSDWALTEAKLSLTAVDFHQPFGLKVQQMNWIKSDWGRRGGGGGRWKNLRTLEINFSIYEVEDQWEV
jgi:hypothetical protein